MNKPIPQLQYAALGRLCGLTLAESMVLSEHLKGLAFDQAIEKIKSMKNENKTS